MFKGKKIQNRLFSAPDYDSPLKDTYTPNKSLIRY